MNDEISFDKYIAAKQIVDKYEYQQKQVNKNFKHPVTPYSNLFNAISSRTRNLLQEIFDENSIVKDLEYLSKSEFLAKWHVGKASLKELQNICDQAKIKMRDKDMELLLVKIKTTKQIRGIVFRQFPFYPCFNKDFEFQGDEILGFVMDKDKKYLIWSKNNQLKKTYLPEYKPSFFHETSLDFSNIIIFEDYKEEIAKYRVFLYGEVLSEQELEERRIQDEKKSKKCQFLCEKYKEFIDSIEDKQLYII